MTRNQFLIFAAVVELIFGLGFLLAPAQILAPMGVTLNPGGVVMTRVLGAALLALAYFYWAAREMPQSSAATIMIGGGVYSAVSGIPVLMAVLGGLANFMGWATVLLHAVLTAGLLYFARVGR